uniref:receptor-like protein EIX1 n=1 Tax=Erigeron canadensis TaxID=72917 RepID=UPI001CB99D95|nr:receptor-like protein EIX1 [Erigeron canadensis]
MENTFLLIFASFMFIQTYCASSNNIMIMASSNVTCIQGERQSLLVFRRGLADESNRLSTWTGSECCEWQGVGCDRKNGHVVKLDLRSPSSFMDYYISSSTSTSLKGKVSPSLLDLKYLRYLDLSMNNFSGQNIPEFFGSFKYLEYLNLSYSGFSGVVPPHLGNLSRLQYLDLNLQHRYDMVPLPYDVSLMVKNDLQWVSLLSSLKHLDLSGIKIGNHIDWFHPVNMLPSLLTLNLASCDIHISSIKFINFTYLNSLDLSSNGINSTIPVWLSNLTSLVHLNLDYNNFHGPIPNSIATLSSLSYIRLSSNHLSGPIPPSLGNLSSLRVLSLYGNQLSGSIPESIGQLSMLEILYLYENQLSGSIPESIGQLSKLEILFLFNNRLSGSIPESIGQLSMLEYLDLVGNRLSGSIPESIGQLSMLEYLDLVGNRLSGSIPESIGQLSMLEYLDLVGNRLSGSIPESIGQLSMLEYLDLSDNQLSGSIPESIGQLSVLENLDLSGNRLSGSLPESIGQLSMLEILYLFGNRLSGSIPTSIGQLSNLIELFVSNNSLVGVVSEHHFTKLRNLNRLWLYDNSLMLNVSTHWIPPFQLESFSARSCYIGPQFPNWLQTQTNLEVLGLSNSGIRDTIPEWYENITSHLQGLDLSHNQISFFHEKTNNCKFKFSNPGLIDLVLGNNSFTGSIPTHLCESLQIKLLDLSDNNFSGFLPKCFGNLTELHVMDLTNNNITGDVPKSLGFLSYLESLHLHNNKFEGNLPTALQNLTNLVTFDLGNNLFTGNIPSWIGKKLTRLKILNLQSNNFTGEIPLEICQNNALQNLNLANNNITGMIPRCFYNLTGMIVTSVDFHYNRTRYKENIETCIKGIQLKYTKTLEFLVSLDLSSNKFIGEVPDVLMNLRALNNLNLSRNLLSGQIPSKIGDLKHMESLDISMNLLSGPIPPSLGTLNFLSYLNLSFNNLSGQIPFGNQLQALGDPSAIYEGNNELCGPTPFKSCNRKNLSDSYISKEVGKIFIQDLGLLISTVSGFVVGFMGLIGSLYLIKEWRTTYFDIIENVYTWLVLTCPEINLDLDVDLVLVLAPETALME